MYNVFYCNVNCAFWWAIGNWEMRFILLYLYLLIFFFMDCFIDAYLQNQSWISMLETDGYRCLLLKNEIFLLLKCLSVYFSTDTIWPRYLSFHTKKSTERIAKTETGKESELWIREIKNGINTEFLSPCSMYFSTKKKNNVEILEKIIVEFESSTFTHKLTKILNLNLRYKLNCISYTFRH